MGDIIVLTIIAVILLCAIVYLWKGQKQGNSCHGHCAGCQKACIDFDKIRQEIKQNS